MFKEEDHIELFLKANREYEILKSKTLENELAIIDWRVIHYSRYELACAQLSPKKEALLFIKYFNDSIEYFTDLVNEKEAKNLDERVYIMYYMQDANPDLLTMLCTARAPIGRKKVKKNLWQKAINDKNYYSFYAEIDSAKDFITASNIEIASQIEIFLIRQDNNAFLCTTKNFQEGILFGAKAILILNKTHFDDRIISELSNSYVDIERIV